MGGQVDLLERERDHALEMAEHGPESCRAALEGIRAEVPGTLTAQGADELLGLLDAPGYWRETEGVPALMLGVRAQWYWYFDPELAVRAVPPLLDRYPDVAFGPVALNALAEYYLITDQHEAGAEAYARLVDLYPGAPQAPEAAGNAGICYLHGEMWEEAVAALPVSDTIKRAGADRLVRETLPRRDLWAVQTPQVFHFDIIAEAYRQVKDEVTDDASLVERLGYKVKLYPGSYDNIKVTTPADLALAGILVKK